MALRENTVDGLVIVKLSGKSSVAYVYDRIYVAIVIAFGRTTPFVLFI